MHVLLYTHTPGLSTNATYQRSWLYVYGKMWNSFQLLIWKVSGRTKGWFGSPIPWENLVFSWGNMSCRWAPPPLFCRFGPHSLGATAPSDSTIHSGIVPTTRDPRQVSPRTERTRAKRGDVSPLSDLPLFALPSTWSRLGHEATTPSIVVHFRWFSVLHRRVQPSVWCLLLSSTARGNDFTLPYVLIGFPILMLPCFCSWSPRSGTRSTLLQVCAIATRSITWSPSLVPFFSGDWGSGGCALNFYYWIFVLLQVLINSCWF
jgi:hypothetical protein